MLLEVWFLVLTDHGSRLTPRIVLFERAMAADFITWLHYPGPRRFVEHTTHHQSDRFQGIVWQACLSELTKNALSVANA
jgi:hypothetical protein